jgi:flavin-dependent dehydrogenase
MPAERFDTIVVGARCAGAPLATHLVRAGQRVLLLDAGKLPSDQPMSTHFVGPVGVDWLDELGVGGELRRMAPASKVLRLDLDGTKLDVTFKNDRAGYCLRRMHLDRLLQEAAIGAGALVKDRTRVVGLVREGDRVVGVETDHEGTKTTYLAAVVVGADGRQSTIAELTGAREYLGYDNKRFGYWAYWRAKPAWRQDPELAPFDAYIGFYPDRVIRFVFQTDDDLLCIGATPVMEDLPAWRGRHEAKYLEALRAAPALAKLVEGHRYEGKLLGLVHARYYFREPVGPGFALVGDAGLHKDPTPGFGITDALRDARNLARAIITGGDAALRGYWRQRDIDSLDLFHFAQDMSDPGYLSPLNRVIYAQARSSPAILARLAAQADREISPYEVVPTPTVLRWALRAALRGKLSAVSSLLTAGKRRSVIDRARREQLARFG